MKVVAAARIIEAQEKYPAAHEYLHGWYQIIKQTNFSHFDALYQTFGDIRGFKAGFKFPIPETDLLVHALIDFSSHVVFIEQVKPGQL